MKSKMRGFAVPLAMVAIMMLLAMGVGLLNLGLTSRTYSARTAADIAARCAADAGLTKALFEMNEKLKTKPWSDGVLPTVMNQPLSSCDATFSYEVVPSAGGYVVGCIGTSGYAERRIYATIELQGPFEHAILTKNSLILKSGTVVDGYNSTDPLDTDADVDIGTQSTAALSVYLNMGVTVDGSVIVGVGGNPDTVIKDLGATTQGKYAATSNDPLPQITPPSLTVMGQTIAAKGETVTLTPDDNGQYGNISLAKGGAQGGAVPGVLEVTGGDVVLYITGDIDLGQDCEIVVRDDATLTLYVDGDIHCNENSGVNSESPPEEASTLKLYGTSDSTQDFDIKAKSAWTGVIYAPNADIDLYAKGDAYGSVVANTFEFKAGGKYHYDEALRNVEVDDEAVRFVVTRWHEGDYDPSVFGVELGI
ncbi:MAG: collagen-binding domain-containing protein [Planctomycetota bacterium]